MTKKPNIVVKGWWPENVRAWFKKEFARENLSPEAQGRLKRLAWRPEMEKVAIRLQKEEQKPHSFEIDRSVYFLRAAWEAPENWKAGKDRNRPKELSDFALQCEAFIRSLQKEQEMVVYSFVTEAVPRGTDRWEVHDSPDPRTINPKSLTPAQARFSELLKTLRRIIKSARSGHDAWPGPVPYTFPKKLNSEVNPQSPEEVFCMTQLFYTTVLYYGDPLCSEVANTVTVILDCDITNARAKSTWNELKKRNPSLALDRAFRKAEISGQI